MNPAWPEDIRDQCREANVPFHFKQWGHWAPEELIVEGISARAQRINVIGRDGELIRLVKVGKARGGENWEERRGIKCLNYRHNVIIKEFI
jgi:hypothetical protein